jgi:glycosyltransferase involved in cell wall biosynthesis
MTSLKENNLIRVMMLVPSLPPMPAGGAELQALKLGKTLSEKDVLVSFITPGKKDISGKTIINGMTVYRMNSWLNKFFNFLSVNKKKRQVKITRIAYNDALEITDQMTDRVGLPTIVYYNIFFYHSLFFLWRKRKEFDIIHAHTMEWSAIVAVRLGKALNKPVIIKDSTMNGFRSLSRFPFGRSHQNLLKSYANFIAMTETIHQNFLNSGIPSERITKIPNGINTEEAIEKIINKSILPKVLFVGNLYQQPAKGLDILFRAWTIVHRSFPDAILQIVGDGDTKVYHEYVDGLGIGGSVQFLGKQSSLSDFYKTSAVFVLPSRREGMSNALMEAMLHAMPCIATDISGNRDLITDHLNGLLVPSIDANQLAEGISYLISQRGRAMEMGIQARETIISGFDIRMVADQYILLYNKLLEMKIKSSPN